MEFIRTILSDAVIILGFAFIGIVSVVFGMFWILKNTIPK